MPVQADHVVCRAHDHMQVVADHQHRTLGALADLLNALVELGNTSVI
tara:strand:- start:16 stop:156 length:141 start_codon:yes stop_codon:yes gene_type:complete